MKRHIKLLFLAVLSLPLIIAAAAAAETPKNNIGSAKTDQVAATSTESTTKPPNTIGTPTSNSTSTTTDSDTVNLQKRLDERKAEMKLKLTTAEQQHIGLRCKASQGSLSSLNGRIKGIETNRTEVYTKLVDRLSHLGAELKVEKVDPAKLDAEVTELKAKIATFNTDFAAYKQTVSDLAIMDCAKDPTAFKASLETARTARETVAKDAAAIRTYTQGTIKPTLQELRDQLAKKQPTTPGSN